MPPAARKGDSTVHTTSLDGGACSTVKVGGKNAWRVGDFHSCSAKNYTPAGSPVPHGGGSVLKGSFTVLIGGQPAARKTDVVVEPVVVPPTTPFLTNNTITAGEGTVEIGDRAFGLLDPAIMRQFCAEWRKLLQDWAGLPSEAERQRRMENVVNNALQAAGVPPVEGVLATAPNSAQAVYYQTQWQGNPAHAIGVPPGTFGPTPPRGGLGSVLYHEARHASQWGANARYLAGQGLNAGQIQARTGTSARMAQAAVANPAGSGTAIGQHGLMNDRQNYGSGKHYNGRVRQNQINVFNSPGPGSAQYTDAMDMYWTLPNERDAEDAGEALRAICPDSR
jgi:uncharacterized Zn-binding protein involved in type VI secretion